MATVVAADCITRPCQVHQTRVSIMKENGYKIAYYALKPEMEND